MVNKAAGEAHTGDVLHEDLVVGAPLSMEEHDTLSGYAWSVRFSEGS